MCHRKAKMANMTLTLDVEKTDGCAVLECIFEHFSLF